MLLSLNSFPAAFEVMIDPELLALLFDKLLSFLFLLLLLFVWFYPDYRIDELRVIG
jgi:hypothetical protein